MEKFDDIRAEVSHIGSMREKMRLEELRAIESGKRLPHDQNLSKIEYTDLRQKLLLRERKVTQQRQKKLKFYLEKH